MIVNVTCSDCNFRQPVVLAPGQPDISIMCAGCEQELKANIHEAHLEGCSCPMHVKVPSAFTGFLY